MSVLLLPGKLSHQPSYAAELAGSKGLISCIAPWYRGDWSRKRPATSAPALVPTRQGMVFNVAAGGGGIKFSAANTINIPAGDFTCIAAIPKAALVGNNPGLWRDGSTSNGGNFCIIQGAGVNRPWIRVNGTDVLKPTSGPQLVVGEDIIIAFRIVSAASADVWWNGVRQHSASHIRAVAAFYIYNIGYQASINEYIGDIAGFWMWDRALTDPEMRDYTLNPWQLFKAPTRRLWAVTSGSTHNLAGASSTQSDTTSTAAITQAQVLAGAASSQASTSSTGAITLGAVNDLISAASIQGNTAGTAAITQTQVLTAATSLQSGTSAAVAITQIHVLTGAAATQGNLGGTSTISFIGEFVGTLSIQGNLSGIGQITRTQALTGAGSIQANLSSAGAISDGIVVETTLMTGITGTIRIKKPGIPAGTPEWLRTMLEIIVGRRGNKIEIPNFQTITFSATPTQTECEALYSYTNDVRTAVENIITRLDS